jgi:hypothetical protein
MHPRIFHQRNVNVLDDAVQVYFGLGIFIDNVERMTWKEGFAAFEPRG